jgi:putative flippase GtrA
LTQEIQRLLKFIIISVFRTLLDILIWQFLVFLQKDKKKTFSFFAKLNLNKFAIAQVFAFIISVFLSYFLNKIFVFQTDNNQQEVSTLFKFIFVSLVSFFVSTWFINFLTSDLKMLKLSKIHPFIEKHWPLLSKIFTIGITLIINYSGYYFLVF